MSKVKIYDTSRNLIAILQNATDVGYRQRVNQLWTAWFSLPGDDSKISHCSTMNYAEIYDGTNRVELFRIIKRTPQRKGKGTVYRFDCEHVLGTLADDVMLFTQSTGPDPTTAINYVLGKQGVTNWALGTVGFTKNYNYNWTNKSLLAALLSIPTKWLVDYQWTFDTTTYPWTINLVVPSSQTSVYIDYGRNEESITKEEDATGMYTRLYAYGYGQSGTTGQINISSANPTGLEYIDSTNISTYGTITRVWEDQHYTDATELYNAAVARLAYYDHPRTTYRVKAADLYRITGETIDHFTLGAQVQVTDSGLGVDVAARIVELTKPDILGKPGDVSIVIKTMGNELPVYGDVAWADNLDDVPDGSGWARVLSTSVEAGKIKLSAIDGGVLGAIPSPPTVAGLYLGASHLGYHNGSSWITYMDIDGKFRLEGTAGHLYWDPVADSLDIKGAVTITSGTTYDDIQQALSDAATAQATADGKIVSFWQTSAPTSGMNEGDIWFDTDDGNHAYRYSGTAWEDAKDSDIAQALSDAATAQSTADGKVTTFYQTSAPTAEGVGDLWVDTDDNNKLYRWNGSDWSQQITGAVASLNVIGSAYIDDLAVTNAKIADAAITNAKIANATITYAKIASVDASKITTGYLSASRIAAGTIDVSKLYIDDDVNFAANGTYHKITGADKIFFGSGGSSSHMSIGRMATSTNSLDIRNTGYSISILGYKLNVEATSTAADAIRLQGYNITMDLGSYPYDNVVFKSASTTGGQWGYGYIDIEINGVARSIAIEQSH